MKKFFLVMTVFTASIIGAKAQSKSDDGNQGFHLAVGVNAALPTGTFKNGYKFGIGGQVQGEYGFAENLTGVFTTGYTSFSGKTYSFDDGFGNTISSKNPSLGHIPILVGARYYVVPQFFAGAQIGYGLFTGSGSGNPKGFEYRPQVGADLGPIQAIISYDGTSVTGGTISQLALSVLYVIGK